MGSICQHFCTSNRNCSGDQLCCTNSCGSLCMDPTFVPFYAVPRVCPTATLEGLVGTCSLTDESCGDNSECDGGELCCNNRCGRTCQDAVNSRIPCFTVREAILAAIGGGIPPRGLYIPSCLSDGVFEPIQCNNSTGLCWCADVRSGRPLTSYSPRGSRPQCSSEFQCWSIIIAIPVKIDCSRFLRLTY